MDEITISLDDSPIISQPSPVMIGDQPPVVVQENFVGGRSATIQIGTVETLPAGSEAYVQNVGTDTDAVFNFGIPEGERGLSGSDGEDGSDGQAATITIGTVSTGLPDTNASVTNVGTSSAAVLDFTIPRGSQGERGLQGVAGEDGVSPIAYVTQTSTGATIHIEDAQNVTDAVITNGTDGTDGTDGFSPIANVTQNTGYATITITDANGTTTANVYDGSDAPIPNDGTLTIQKNGTTVQTFTANQSSNATANITVPTQFSDLSGTVGTTQIANTAITNANIDWSDLFTNSDVYHVGSGGTEQIVGKWNDGRNLYRTVIWIGLGENVESVVDMASYNIYEIVQFFEVMKTNDGSYFPAYYYANGDDWARWYYGGGDKKIHAISRWGSRGMILTLYYTKAS